MFDSKFARQNARDFLFEKRLDEAPPAPPPPYQVRVCGCMPQAGSASLLNPAAGRATHWQPAAPLDALRRCSLSRLALRKMMATSPFLAGRAVHSAAPSARSAGRVRSTTTAKLSWCPGGTGKLNPTYLDGRCVFSSE